jgi:diamine N-acetyltransferase
VSTVPSAELDLRPVGATSWRDVAGLRLGPEQERFVATTSYYLALCAYDEPWHPLAVHDRRAGDAVVGFLMWGIDGEDGSCWLGGLVVDAAQQGRGVGRAAVVEAMRMLSEQVGSTDFALAYHPANVVAKGLYASLGFVETGEVDGDEVVARLSAP